MKILKFWERASHKFNSDCFIEFPLALPLPLLNHLVWISLKDKAWSWREYALGHRFITKGYNGAFIAGCWKKNVQEVSGKTMEEPILEGMFHVYEIWGEDDYIVGCLVRLWGEGDYIVGYFVRLDGLRQERLFDFLCRWWTEVILTQPVVTRRAKL